MTLTCNPRHAEFGINNGTTLCRGIVERDGRRWVAFVKAPTPAEEDGVRALLRAEFAAGRYCNASSCEPITLPLPPIRPPLDV